MAALRKTFADHLAARPDGPADEGPTPDPLAVLPFPDEEAEEARERAGQWISSLKPWDAFEMWLVEQIGVQALRIERCQADEAARRSRLARRAALCWDDDRLLDAEVLGATLAKSPAVVARQLRKDRAGCSWLIGRWEGLARILEANGAWTGPQRSLALDLLGTPPDLRDGPTPADGAPAALGALAADQVDQLRRLQVAALDDLDRLDRAAAARGSGPTFDRELAPLRRLERSCTRWLEWLRAQFKKLRPASYPGADGPARSFSADPPARAEPPVIDRPEAHSANAGLLRAIPAAAPAPEPEPAGMPDAARARLDVERDDPPLRDATPIRRVHDLVTGKPAGTPPPVNRKARRAAASRVRSRLA